ncbi:MAG: hypothetical protein R2771_07315 [Saprospiraceae bacterium]
MSIHFLANSTSSSTSGSIANKSTVGSVWGMAFKKTTQQLFMSAFVKQYAFISPSGQSNS